MEYEQTLSLFDIFNEFNELNECLFYFFLCSEIFPVCESNFRFIFELRREFKAVYEKTSSTQRFSSDLFWLTIAIK